jgi:hypothetical protein
MSDDTHAFLVERGAIGEGMHVMGSVERLPVLGKIACSSACHAAHI